MTGAVADVRPYTAPEAAAGAEPEPPAAAEPEATAEVAEETPSA